MTEKYIKASECEKYFYEHLDDNGMIGAMNAIDEMPAADVQPVKRGRWKVAMMSEATGWDLSLTGGRDEVCEYNCSVCGQVNILDEFGENFLPPYCPFCGAEMENPETIKG